VTATITLYEPDPDSPGGRRWASYCDTHDPDPPAAEATAT
jgi:hypothetical protein